MPSNEADPLLLEPAAAERLMQCCKSLASWKSVLREPLPTEITSDILDHIEVNTRAHLRPATNAEVIGAIKRLRMHFGEWSQLTETEEADIWRDWLLDFKSYPKALLTDACAQWRNSTAKRPPTPGQLKALVHKELLRLRHLETQARRARRALTDSERTWQS